MELSEAELMTPVLHWFDANRGHRAQVIGYGHECDDSFD